MQPDKQLSRVAFCEQVQVGVIACIGGWGVDGHSVSYLMTGDWCWQRFNIYKRFRAVMQSVCV